VYQLAPASHGKWRERVLYSFKGGTDGSNSISNLVLDAAGNLYGTTSEGGAPGCSCGTVFKLSRGDAGRWTESVLHRFVGAPDGAYPYAGMVLGSNGRLYGATVHGGEDDEGSVYELGP
jgi:uncharacterized repeat protein (TIGR03803 family)